MRWLKRNPLNSIAIGILLFLALITWMSIQVYEPQSAHATAGGTVQGTPTVNTTAVVQDQLKQQDEKLQRDNSFPGIILNAVGSSIGTILVAAAAIIAAWLGWRQWLTNRKDEQKKRREDQLSEQEKRAEERFQKVVEGFGGDNEGAKVGAAILLRTFLRPGYEQFYTQTFDLAVANLRLPRTPHASEDPDGIPYQPKDQETPLLLTTLSQALIVVFKEAFPLARTTIIGSKKYAPPLQSLDATNIQLDNAFLAGADLKQAWVPHASLRKANLITADLFGAYLSDADLSAAYLSKADLSYARLSSANLSSANLREADLIHAFLLGANLSGANLSEADLSAARSLEGTKLSGVKGLDEKQLAMCEIKGAIIDKDSTTRSSQPTVSPSPSNDVQALPTPLAQGNTPAPDAGSNSAASS